MKKFFLLLCIYFLVAFTAQAQMFTFNFTGTGTCTPITQGNAVIQPSNVTVQPLTRNNLSCTQTNDYFNTASWSQSPSIDTGQYIELTIKADSNSRLKLSAISFTHLKSSSGPATCRVAHNASGSFSTFNEFTPNSTTNTIYTWNFPEFTTGLGATVKFRIYGWGASGSTGTLRINNLSVYGNAILNSPLSYDYTKGYVGVGLAGNATPTQRLQVDGGNILLTNGRLMIGGIATAGPGIDTASMRTNGYAFGVNGTAIVNKLIVKKSNATAWPDYIFGDGYKLVPLDSLQGYIKQNHHLPGMPSAEDVDKNDIDISSTQAALLRQLEELTLYIIEENIHFTEERKKGQAQAGEIDRLRQDIKELKMRLPKGKTK